MPAPALHLKVVDQFESAKQIRTATGLWMKKRNEVLSYKKAAEIEVSELRGLFATSDPATGLNHVDIIMKYVDEIMKRTGIEELDAIAAVSQNLPTSGDLPTTRAENALRAIQAVLRNLNMNPEEVEENAEA